MIDGWALRQRGPSVITSLFQFQSILRIAMIPKWHVLAWRGKVGCIWMYGHYKCVLFSSMKHHLLYIIAPIGKQTAMSQTRCIACMNVYFSPIIAKTLAYFMFRLREMQLLLIWNFEFPTTVSPFPFPRVTRFLGQTMYIMQYKPAMTAVIVRKSANLNFLRITEIWGPALGEMGHLVSLRIISV